MLEENMTIWNEFAQPPKTALKQITGGRLKGKTDINPQWRYEAMTKVFGIVGIGWKFTIDKEWVEAGANGEFFVFVNVSVFVKVDGSWSDAIQGNGGAKLVVKESSGMYNDDNAYKKATTDALSTAMKMLGVAADIYAGKFDGSKFSEKSNAKKGWSGDQLQAVINAGAASNIPHAKNILEGSNLRPPENNAGWCGWYAKAYLKAKEAGLSTEDARAKTNKAYAAALLKEK